MPIFFFYKHYSERELKMNINLQPQVAQTKDGLYVVTYASLNAPLNVQEAAFAAHGLHTASPAELGYLRAGVENSPFTPYSRTDMDVFYDDRGGGKVVLARDRAISKLFLSDLVNAHRKDKELIIPKDQRELVYATIDAMLENGRALATGHGVHRIDTSRFGEDGLTEIMFSDPSLGIHAADYGAWLNNQGRDTQSLFFDSKDYAKSQKGPYLNRLRVFGPGSGFDAGDGRYLGDDGSAFGVRLEKTAEGGAKK